MVRDAKIGDGAPKFSDAVGGTSDDVLVRVDTRFGFTGEKTVGRGRSRWSKVFKVCDFGCR